MSRSRRSGGSAARNIAGTDGDDTLEGTRRNDRIDGGLGADVMSGGRGNDVYIVDNAGDVVVEERRGGDDQIRSSVSYTLPENVETLVLTGSDDIDGTGNAGRNTLVGNDGANVLDGGAGRDRMSGGAGDDTYVVDDRRDDVREQRGEGDDTVQSSISWRLDNHVENLVLTGSGDTSARGNNAANTITGNDGDNYIDGRQGADTMAGGLGDDRYEVDNAGDLVIEADGAGIDTVIANHVDYTLPDFVENLVLRRGGHIDGTGNELDNTLTGNGSRNTLHGLGGDDVLDGGRSNDFMAGGEGDDTYYVDHGRDVVSENAGEGIDTVYSRTSFRLPDEVEHLFLTGSSSRSGTGNDLDNEITGNRGNNRLRGEGGEDTLDGGRGHDLLDGGLGHDVLTGGSGRDAFQFSTELGADNVDLVTDFLSAHDVLRLDADIFDVLGVGRLSAANFVSGAGATAADADDFIVHDSTTGVLSYDADGSGAGEAVAFATLAGTGTLIVAGDIFVV